MLYNLCVGGQDILLVFLWLIVNIYLESSTSWCYFFVLYTNIEKHLKFFAKIIYSKLCDNMYFIGEKNMKRINNEFNYLKNISESEKKKHFMILLLF